MAITRAQIDVGVIKNAVRRELDSSLASLPRPTVLVLIRMYRFKFQQACLTPELPTFSFTGSRPIKHSHHRLAVVTIFLPLHLCFYSLVRGSVHLLAGYGLGIED